MIVHTIKRRKWHRPEAKWQATDANGYCFAYRVKPILDINCVQWWPANGECGCLSVVRRPPADWTSTLRRIEPVTRKAGAK